VRRTIATKRELAQAIETVCILSNKDTMIQIVSSKNDIKRGKFKEVRSVEDIEMYR